VEYHGLARCYLAAPRFVMRPLLNGGTLGGRRARHETHMLTRDEDALMFRENLGVVPVDRMLGRSPADTFALKGTYAEARSTMRTLGVVQRIEEAWFGGGVGGAAAVFLFRFIDLDSNELYGWLICGDIPWFFTLVSEGDFSRAILERYVALAREWNLSGGVEPDGCFFGPYHAELVDDLMRRLVFIEQTIVPIMPVPNA
jgi:hypothetical protein